MSLLVDLDSGRAFAARVLLGVVASILGLSLLALPSGVRAAPAGTVEVQALGGGSAVPVSGTVIPIRQVTLNAQFGGRVDFIAGQEGERFEEGGILVGMDEEQLRAQREAAQAGLAQAQARLRDAQVQFQRERLSPNTASKQMGMPFMDMIPFGGGQTPVDRRANLHAAGTAVETARSGVDSAQSHIREIDARFADARSTAPFNGMILEKFVNAGDTVNRGQALMSFGDTEFLQIQAEVPTKFASQLSLGEVILARLDNAGSEPFRVRVAQIYPKADERNRTIRIKFDLPKRIKTSVGAYASVLIPRKPGTKASSLPVIPRSAIVRRGGGLPMAYVVSADGQSRHLRLLRLGEAMGDDKVSVLSGLRVGEFVLLDPPKR